MPRELRGEQGREAHFMHARSNLWWRGPNENRALDHIFIDTIKDESIVYARRSPHVRQQWQASRIEMFLRTKHDEALVFPGDLIEPYRLKPLEAYNISSNWMMDDSVSRLDRRTEPLRDAIELSNQRPYARTRRRS
jgi:hypothetical protein